MHLARLRLLLRLGMCFVNEIPLLDPSRLMYARSIAGYAVYGRGLSRRDLAYQAGYGRGVVGVIECTFQAVIG